MAANGFTRYPRDLRLTMLNDEPVYPRDQSAWNGSCVFR
jgi:hypothetical protein